MPVAISEFDWDVGNRGKCEAHGVTIGEIESLFTEPIAVFPDPAHSVDEERFKAIGKTKTDRSVLIVFTLRQGADGVRIRPISARYMHRKEIEYYEKEAAKVAQRRGS